MVECSRPQMLKGGTFCPPNSEHILLFSAKRKQNGFSKKVLSLGGRPILQSPFAAQS